jgi:chromate transporter
MKTLLTQGNVEDSRPEGTQHPNFGEAFRFWLKLGFISFGGPTGQIAIMHAELVEKKKWISEARFLHALNYCMLLPGPEAQQLAIYVGWLLHKTWGGIVAGALFVIRRSSFYGGLAISMWPMEICPGSQRSFTV